MMSDRERALLTGPNFASVATLTRSGDPQVSVTWVDAEGEDVLINTAEGRAKVANVRRDPRIAMTVPDSSNPYDQVIVRGRVTEVTREGAEEHIDALAKRYLGEDVYPFRGPGEKRVILRVRPERVIGAFMSG